MQIIAEISEDDYNRIINKSYWSNDPDYTAAEYAIAHGTVLPEKHGDLVDKDALWDAYHDLDYDFYEAYDSVPTILGKEGEEE